MEPYVVALLARVKPLREQYLTAVEINRVAWVEQRDCRLAMERVQQERDHLITLLAWWAECPATKFEDREVLTTAVSSLQTAGRGDR